MSVDHEDVAIRSHGDVGRTIEGVLPVTGNTGCAEGHQERPVGCELHDLMALASDPAGIRHPEVVVRVDEESVRPVEQAFAPAVQEPSGRVVFQDRGHIFAPSVAVFRETTMEDPKVTLGVEVDTDGLTPRLYTVRQLRPPLDQAVGRLLGLNARGGDRSRGDECCDERYHRYQSYSLHV